MSIVESAPAAAAAIASSAPTELRYPHEATLRASFQCAMNEDKSISSYYWADSLVGSCVIGVRKSTNEKLLFKSAEEFTSPILSIKQSHDEYIIETENTIYIVCKTIPKRAIK